MPTDLTMRNAKNAASKAIEPDGIWSPSMGESVGRFGTNIPWTEKRVTNMGVERKYQPPRYHPNPFMRKLGFTRNPAICGHERKQFYPGQGWNCRDCGEEVKL